jgi:hypothetical protein
MIKIITLTPYPQDEDQSSDNETTNPAASSAESGSTLSSAPVGPNLGAINSKPAANADKPLLRCVLLGPMPR